MFRYLNCPLSYVYNTPPKARPRHICMSWPSNKPPWKHVKWIQTPVAEPHDVQLNPVWSLLLPFPDISGKLFTLKGQIEALDKTDEWEYLKRTSNPYELVFSQSQDYRIPASVCSLKPLSRSFFKMVEILHVMNFFKRHTSNIRSAHVCEGPGGFIEALLHLSLKNSFTLASASAMTLRPSKPNIPGWKRAYTFLKKAPMVKINYGADDTGDIMVPKNQLAFLENIRGKCTIFTADGGFDFSEHYSRQEDEVFPLLVSSVLIGLQTMVCGGDFVLKLFDTEMKSTCDLLVLLSLCFDSWTIYKPALSRPCNAEKYFLGRGCRPIPAWIIKTLIHIRDTCSRGTLTIRSIFSNLPDHIQVTIDTLKKEFLDQQVAALEYAISHKEEWNKDPNIVWKSIYTNSVNWCHEFNIPVKLDTWMIP